MKPYMFLVLLYYKEIKIKDLPQVFLDSCGTTAIVMLLIGASMSMSWIMSFENIPQNLSDFLLTLSDNKIIILMIVNLLLLFVGIFMDMTPAVLIFTPIFLPIVTSIGINPIQFGIIMVLNLCIGLCTPPVGSVLFVGIGLAKTSIEKVIKPLLPLFIAMIFSLIKLRWSLINIRHYLLVTNTSVSIAVLYSHVNSIYAGCGKPHLLSEVIENLFTQ